MTDRYEILFMANGRSTNVVSIFQLSIHVSFTLIPPATRFQFPFDIIPFRSANISANKIEFFRGSFAIFPGRIGSESGQMRVQAGIPRKCYEYQRYQLHTYSRRHY